MTFPFENNFINWKGGEGDAIFFRDARFYLFTDKNESKNFNLF